MAEGERLQESYPGSNAENIVELLESLIRAWEELKAAAIARNTKLVASYDYHKFLAQVCSPWNLRIYKIRVHSFICIYLHAGSRFHHLDSSDEH
jgi:hypothetical protein